MNNIDIKLYKQYQKIIVVFLLFALSLQSCSINYILKCEMNTTSEAINTKEYRNEEHLGSLELTDINNHIRISNNKNGQNQTGNNKKYCSHGCKYFLFLITGVILGALIVFIPLYLVDKAALITDAELYKACTDSNSTLGKALSASQAALNICEQSAQTCLNLKNDLCGNLNATTCGAQFPHMQIAYNSDCL